MCDIINQLIILTPQKPFSHSSQSMMLKISFNTDNDSLRLSGRNSTQLQISIAFHNN